MSGHSKWAQIKRQKGALDIKRGQAFTKISNVITIAVRDGGGITDPNQNFRLRLAIEKARAVNMPKENVQRAIDRGKGKGEKGEGLQEVVYEGFGPNGIALIAEATTDNKLRTNSEVKQVLERNGASLATPGAVSYMFTQKGLITVKKNGKSTDDIFLIAADAGAEDVEEAGEEVLIYTKAEDLSAVKTSLSDKLMVEGVELTRKPTTTVAIQDKATAQRILSLMEKLEEMDDVQKVYSNFDIPDELMRL